METETLLQQGIDLMLFGMLTVVLFLGLLVVAVGAMSALLARFAPAPLPAAASPRESDAPAPAVVAAITAAITAHRARAARGNRASHDKESR